MKPIWMWLGLGVLLIVSRRPFAREIVKSQAFWFDRARDDDEVARVMALIGGVMIAGGLVFLGIWLLN